MTYGDTQSTQLSLTGDLGALRQRLYERAVTSVVERHEITLVLSGEAKFCAFL